MSLQSVLTHRARLIARERTGAQAEGTRQYGETLGPWFRCRLFPEEGSETDGVRSGRRTLAKGPHVVVGPRDLTGAAIGVDEIAPDKFMEIDGGVLGVQRWQITSAAQAIVPKKKVLAFYFTVRRVEVAGAAE